LVVVFAELTAEMRQAFALMVTSVAEMDYGSLLTSFDVRSHRDTSLLSRCPLRVVIVRSDACFRCVFAANGPAHAARVAV
jgi:hypothetical protein